MRKIATDWEESAHVAARRFKHIPVKLFPLQHRAMAAGSRVRVVKNVGWGEGLYRAVHPDGERGSKAGFCGNIHLWIVLPQLQAGIFFKSIIAELTKMLKICKNCNECSNKLEFRQGMGL